MKNAIGQQLVEDALNDLAQARRELQTAIRRVSRRVKGSEVNQLLRLMDRGAGLAYRTEEGGSWPARVWYSTAEGKFAAWLFDVEDDCAAHVAELFLNGELELVVHSYPVPVMWWRRVQRPVETEAQPKIVAHGLAKPKVTVH